jgi:hypothetical protein
MKYEVQTKFVFYGKFFIEAKDEAQAKELVKDQCGFVMGGDIHTTLPREVCDWDFATHPEKIIVKVREIT